MWKKTKFEYLCLKALGEYITHGRKKHKVIISGNGSIRVLLVTETNQKLYYLCYCKYQAVSIEQNSSAWTLKNSGPFPPVTLL